MAKLMKAARMFIAKHISKEVTVGKRPIKQAIAISFSKARCAGFKVSEQRK